MTTMEKFDAIEAAKSIYDIHFARAGVAFKFYDASKDDGEGEESWRKALTIDRYYPNFRAAVQGEYDRIITPVLGEQSI